MSLQTLRTILSGRDPFPMLNKILKSGARLISVEEIAAEVKPLFAACITSHETQTTVIVTYSAEEAERIFDGLITFGLPEQKLFLVPPSESLLFEDGSPDWGIVGARIRALSQIALDRGGITILPICAAMLRTSAREQFIEAITEITAGQQLDIHRLGRNLAIHGYRRVDLVSATGEFSIRGGLLDVWPPTEIQPVRIDLFDDEVESIRPFDPESQRSAGNITSILVPPAREVIIGDRGESAAGVAQQHLEEQMDALRAQGRSLDADALELRVSQHIVALRQGIAFDGLEYYLPFLTTQYTTLLDWLPSDAIIIWDEPNLSKASWENLQDELAEIAIARAEQGSALAMNKEHHVSFDSARESMLKRRMIVISSLPHHTSWLHTPHHISLPSGGPDLFGAQVGVFAENVKNWIAHGFGVVVITPQVLRVGEMLRELGVRPVHGKLYGEIEPGVTVIEGSMPTGFRLPGMNVIVVADADIFGSTMIRRPRVSRRDSKPISNVSEIKEGDFIVHTHHGIGIYRGMITLNGRDMLLLEYAGGDKLYVPTDQMDRIQKYSGAEVGPPSIHRLGGNDWARTKKKVKAAVREMAKELLQVYAAREALGGHPFGPDTPWQSEMEQGFPFSETDGQLRAIEDVKDDLEKPKPMDRLICGDVGFGKTEVAIRAAFKVVLEGKQVAVLCPTTVLAQQHSNVFAERLAAFPVTVGMLSRFRSPKQQKEILESTKNGGIDIVIGTHRLLSKDVEFRDLGLVIVDEEQRFGVTHKERLKQMRLSVDVLTLTATPIPRTLHMSLSGIRDMSVVNEAPEGRIPVRTYVREFDDELVREALVRELDRNGQIYIVHNRVESIASLGDRIAKLAPYARIAIGHGQMDEHELEQVMWDFYHQKYDVLISTTIIESGLDVPNANTIIINNADKFGLSQLYQLRGRVGRSQRQAYAYLLYKSDMVLTEIAERRLAAIREFADLGSGFKIAMRDLEIRGAGNILGAEQHGQMLSVGFDMYCHLLAQAVKELKGEQIVEDHLLPQIDIAMEAYIPNDYMPIESTRLAIYRKMASMVTEEGVSKVEEELDDRFGPPPAEVRNALAILRLRIQAVDLGIKSVKEENGRIVMLFAVGYGIHPDSIRPLKKAFPEHNFEIKAVSLFKGQSNPIELISEFFRFIERSIQKSKTADGTPGNPSRSIKPNPQTTNVIKAGHRGRITG